MKQTKGAIGNLLNRYRAVLKKCHLLNTFGSLAVAGMLVMGGAGVAQAEGTWTQTNGQTGNWDAGTVLTGSESFILSGTYDGFTSTINNTAGVAAINYNTPNVLVESGTTFRNNSMEAQKGAGGGALKILTGTTIGDNVTFENNTAADGGGWGGGAIYIKLTEGTTPSEQDTVTIGTNAKFTGNTAKNLGGAIALEYGKLVIGKDAVFSNNSTTSTKNGDGIGGGAIAVWHDGDNGDAGNTILTLDGATFEENKTVSSGGAIYNSDGTISISNTNFTQNEAARGGAIYNEAGEDLDFSGSITINNSEFSQNKSANGGALWQGSLSTITISESRFIENSANTKGGLNQGGAITNAGKMTITDTIFSKNQAGSRGGAIANVTPSGVEAQPLTLENVTVTENSAGQMGGGIYNASNTILAFEGTNTITDNQRGTGENLEADDLYNDSGTVNVNSGTTTVDALYNTGTINIGGDSAATLAVNESWTGEHGTTNVNNLGTLSVTRNVIYDDEGNLNSNINATVASGATLAVSGLEDMTLQDVKDLKNALTSGNDFNGSLYLGDIKVTDLNPTGDNGHYRYSQLKDIEEVHLNQLLESTVDVTDEENTGIGGGFKNVHLTGTDTTLIAKGQDLTLAGSAEGGNLAFTTDAEGNETVAGLRIGSTGGDDIDSGANTVVTLGQANANNQGTLGTVTMNAGSGKTATLNVVGRDNAQFTVGDIRTNGSTNKIVVDGAELVTGNISEGNLKDLDELSVTNGALTANGVAELQKVTLNGGIVQSKMTDAENTGNISISGTVSGQGTVLAENTLSLSSGLTTTDGDDLRLQGNAVSFADALNSADGNVTVIATQNLTTTGGATLNGDVVLAQNWTLASGDTITASSSYQHVVQFTASGAAADPDGASNLNTTYTLQENSLLLHGGDELANEAVLEQLRAELDSHGYTGPAYLADKTLNLTSTGKLVVGNAETTVEGNRVVFGDNSVLAVDGDISGAVFTAEGEKNTAHVSNSSKLYAENVKANTEITIFGKGFDTVTVDAEGWTNIQTDTAMLNGSYDSNGNKVTFNVQDAMEQFPGLSEDLAPAVNDLYNRSLNDVESDYMGRRFLSRATNDNYLGRKDLAAAASTIESAARIAFAGAVPQMTKMASDSATNSVVNRMGFANPENGAKAMNVDGKLVDDKALGLALWIAPLWSNQNGFGMEAGNLDYGYNANIGGVSLGADYTWANNFRAGLMFNIGGGYAESSGDLSETTNSMTFWGVGAYGGWKYENFAVMGDVSYTSTWNSVDQDVDSRMQMGDLEADIQASAISAGLRFEYKLETQYLDFIPHVGARYMSINTWGYDVETNGGTVLEGDGFQQNIWTFPVGITFSKELEMNNDWYFKPSVDFTVIPAAGDIKAKEDVRFTGLPYSTEIETQMMDYFTWQGGLGLEFGNDNMSVGVNYTLQAGQNSTGHGVFGMFRYEF